MPDLGASGHLLDSAERDRYRELFRAATLLHDDVGQVLTAMGLQLDLLEMDHPEVSPSIAVLRPIVEAAFASVRALSADLQPDLVTRIGLPAALESLARRAPCQLSGRRVYQFTQAQAAALYRIAECAVDNALIHGGAANVVIHCSAGPPASLQIRDDGIGFDLASTQRGYGLLLMHHLAKANDLKISVHSERGKGTIIEIS